MRLMIVEDEQRARRGLKGIILSLPGEHEVVAEATNGQSALELLKALKVDVVFTDIKMPYMDGLALIQAARQLGFATKFVIISAYEEFEYARKAISLGVTDYLVKPLILEDVREVLEALAAKPVPVPGSQASLGQRYQGAHPAVLRVLKRIETDYAGSLGLKGLSQELEMSPEYFSSLFKKNVGMPFVKFLRGYRIEIAKTLYLHGNVPREEVPFQVGFSDDKYFNRVFKEETGMSVSEFIYNQK